MADDEIKRYLDNWRDERNGAVLYEALAQAENDPRIAEVYRRFAAAEHRHATGWAQRIEAAGGVLPTFRLSWRTRFLAGLARRFGPGLVLPSVMGMEQINARGYRQQFEGQSMAQEEASHARLLRQISGSVKGGLAGGELAQLEGRHRAGGNALRAAVLGANDGLVSNLSLVMGVAGAALANPYVLVTGLAGLLAGACSMALGEWLSVQSSRELYQRQIEIEQAEIETAPEEEAEELALIYQTRGLNEDQARHLARQIFQDKDSALETLAREELGIDPESLGGSAWVAAATSFFLFALGAIVPVIPFTFLRGRAAVLGSGALSAVALFAIGSAITLFTGRPVWRSGLRMVIFGLSAAAITFGIGRLIGISVGG